MKRTTKFLAPLTLMATLALTGCTFLYVPLETSSTEESAKVANIVVAFTLNEIDVGNKTQAYVQISPTNAMNTGITWLSSNPAVATVDSNGVVTAVGEGQTTIKAIATDGSGVFGEAVLTVGNPVGKRKRTLGQNIKDYINHSWEDLDSCPTIGSPKILVIPVWFTNSTDYILESKKEDVRSDIETCYFGSASETGWHSVKSYYEAESMGKFRLDGTVSSWYECGKATSYYNTSAEQTAALVTEATNWYFTNNPTESRQDYDLDGNGGIDAVCLIYGAPDYSAENRYDKSNFWAYCYWTGANPNCDAPTANTFYWASYDFMYSYGPDAKSRTGKASYGSGDTGYCVLDAHSFIHEFGHVLGLEDYYDYSGSSCPGAGFSMQDMNIGGHDPFSTMLFGWAEPYVPAASCEITIGAFQSTHDLIVLSQSWNDLDSPFDEYLLLELYTPTGLNAFDNAHSYGGYPTGASETGIRLWHVDGRLTTVSPRSGRGSAKTGTDATTNNIDFAMSNSYYSTDAEPYCSRVSSFRDYNLLQLIRNRTSSGHKASANDYLRNADLFRSGESFDMDTYGSQFVNAGKLNSNTELGWSFSVSISGSGDAAQATITLTKE